jgi:hypothetical protein
MGEQLAPNKSAVMQNTKIEQTPQLHLSHFFVTIVATLSLYLVLLILLSNPDTSKFFSFCHANVAALL